ncbi:pyridoxal phosphate-dependent aminotransferase [Paroceanicella profunda]|uniref:aspartate transaminase n=1 Tax=Paroceanicella profunda TaxID=2579971 RepID=A0A5B8FVX6_9RHOB|nr:pyridoxal phosphate-dependent aminotransferase [Paroceanicella profunda]QDL90649.1 pyridoxal phosphate-dependent aminotransferase [Paroceanicella profunda]
MRYASITKRLEGLGSGKWAVHRAGRRRMAEGHDVIELTIGEPDIAPDPGLLQACSDALFAGRIRYSDGRGEPALLDALAAKYTARTGRNFTRGNFMCFPGTQTALSVVMQGLVEAGDEVLVGDPYYATYEGVIRATGAAVVPVPLRPEAGFHLDAQDLAAAVTPRSRVVLLNSPHNPTGAVLSAAQIAAIGAVARAHDLWIVCDEVYELLIHHGTFASPLDNPDLAARSIAVSSISKSNAAPGLRSGWAAAPAEAIDTLLPVAETMLFGNQPFIADATAHALTSPAGISGRMTASYRARADAAIEILSAGPGLRPLRPEAGMFLFLDIRGTGVDDARFATGLMEAEDVSVMPGTAFGAGGAGFVRLSLTVPDARLAEACRRILRHAGRCTPARTATPASAGRA